MVICPNGTKIFSNPNFEKETSMTLNVDIVLQKTKKERYLLQVIDSTRQIWPKLTVDFTSKDGAFFYRDCKACSHMSPKEEFQPGLNEVFYYQESEEQCLLLVEDPKDLNTSKIISSITTLFEQKDSLVEEIQKHFQDCPSVLSVHVDKVIGVTISVEDTVYVAAQWNPIFAKKRELLEKHPDLMFDFHVWPAETGKVNQK
jgi:hypothetical protein